MLRTITTLTAAEKGLIPSFGLWTSCGFWVVVMIRQWEKYYAVK